MHWGVNLQDFHVLCPLTLTDCLDFGLKVQSTAKMEVSLITSIQMPHVYWVLCIMFAFMSCYSIFVFLYLVYILISLLCYYYHFHIIILSFKLKKSLTFSYISVTRPHILIFLLFCSNMIIMKARSIAVQLIE